MDVLSPTLDLRDASQWSMAQTVLFGAMLLSTAFPIGVAMHAVSRNLFRKLKDEWDVKIVTSAGVERRLGGETPSRPTGGPSLEEVHAATSEGRHA